MKKEIVFFVVCIFASICINGQQRVNSYLVLPSATDPAINTFDVSHSVYFNPSVKHRNKLVVYLTGTGGDGTRGLALFGQTASDLGFHVVLLTYPSKSLSDADFSPTRIFVGKNKEPEAKVTLYDAQGNARINMLVDAGGAPRLDFLDANGKVTYRLPGNNKTPGQKSD